MVQADYDNDGDVDVLVLRGALARAPPAATRSRCCATTATGASRTSPSTAGLGERYYPTQTAAWADYDNDGDLDLYVGNEEDGRDVTDAPCQLFRNEGDGTFADVAAAAGVENHAFAKGVVWGDYDGDRFPDLYVSQPAGRTASTATTATAPSPTWRAQAGVDAAARQLPGLVLGLRQRRRARPLRRGVPWSHRRPRRGGAQLLRRPCRRSSSGASTGATGAAASATSPRRPGSPACHLAMGSNFGDLDNDGWLDFYLGTGLPGLRGPDAERRCTATPRARLSGRDRTAASATCRRATASRSPTSTRTATRTSSSRWAAPIPAIAPSNVCYRNPGFGSHWIALQLVGTRSNRSAIGARIRVDIVEGGTRRSIYRWVTSGGSFGANPLRQSIGLGAATVVDRLEIYWPTSDTTQVFTAVAADRIYRVVEGEDAIEELRLPAPATPAATAAR